MKASQAREISLELILQDLGFEPAKKNGNDVFYFVREGDKNTPSFKINTQLNKWYDFGVGTGGNTIDAIMFIKKIDFHEAMKYLEKYENHILSSNEIIINNFKKIKYEEEVSYKILEIKSIFSYSLKDYLDERNISFTIANEFLKEIVYELKDKKYYALGFENDSNGFEIRNPFFKGNFIKKDITTINNNSEQLVIFEGVYDFLSFLSLNKEEINKNDYIILNSTSMVNKLKKVDKKYKMIDTYLDNDETGKKVFLNIKEIFNYAKVSDCSINYADYKDLNEYLIDQKKEIKIKRGI